MNLKAEDKMAMGGLAFFLLRKLGKINTSGYFGIDLFLGI